MDSSERLDWLTVASTAGPCPLIENPHIPDYCDCEERIYCPYKSTAKGGHDTCGYEVIDGKHYALFRGGIKNGVDAMFNPVTDGWKFSRRKLVEIQKRRIERSRTNDNVV